MVTYVIGLGHIGLPMAAWVALKDLPVVGIDINSAHLEAIRQGKVNIHEDYQGIHLADLLVDLQVQNKLTVRSDLQRIDTQPAVFLIAVGIETDAQGQLNLRPVLSAVEMILPQLVAGDLLIFRTTMVPGTCEKVIVPRVQRVQPQAHVAYAPETIAETRAFAELGQNPIVLGAGDETGYALAASYLKEVFGTEIHRASNMRTAELAKVIQNISRDVNAAFMNEIGSVAATLDIDVYELQGLANCHPRVKLLEPGPGVGGYCLPNAIRYLEGALGEVQSGVIPLSTIARRINEQKPERVVENVVAALQAAGKELCRARIAVVGLAMKDYCADCRLSPALDIIRILQQQQAEVQAFDPLVPRQFPFQCAALSSCLTDADCLLITAKQEGIQFETEELKRLMKPPLIVVDTRNMFPRNCQDVWLYRV